MSVRYDHPENVEFLNEAIYFKQISDVHSGFSRVYSLVLNSTSDGKYNVDLKMFCAKISVTKKTMERSKKDGPCR